MLYNRGYSKFAGRRNRKIIEKDQRNRFQIEHIEEVPTVTMSGFVSQIGGQLGLFVGVSAITIFQVFFYFLACSLKQCRKLLLKFGKNRSQRTIINMPASDMITNADRNLKKCPSLRNGSYSAHQKHNKIHANLEANFEDISLDNDGNDSKINSIWATSNGRPSWFPFCCVQKIMFFTFWVQKIPLHVHSHWVSFFWA